MFTSFSERKIRNFGLVSSHFGEVLALMVHAASPQHLNSTELLLSLGLGPGGFLGASGPETFGSQFERANSHQAGLPRQWRRDCSHRKSSPSLRGQRGVGIQSLAGPWQLLTLRVHK